MIRAVLIGLTALAALAAIAIFSFVPLFTAKETCLSAADPIGTGEPGGTLNHPMDLAWADGFLFVADTENGSVKKYRRDGQLAGEWKGFKRPVDIAVSGDSVFVADFITDRITRLDKDGSKLDEWGVKGTGEGEFDAPAGIALDREGNVYVTDFYNHRVQKFKPGGAFILAWGSKGRWRGQFRYPTDIAVDREGNILVTDAYNHRVQKFTPDGKFLGKWGGIGYGFPGPWPGWFRLAKAIAVTPAGEILVADPFNNRIQRFSSEGKLISIWDGGFGGDSIRYPAGIAIGNEGVLYVSDFFQNRIVALRCR